MKAFCIPILIAGLIATPALANPTIPVIIASQEVINSGAFVTTEQSHPTVGNVKIITNNGRLYLQLSEDFDTASGPDVNIILYRGSQVPVNIEQEDYYILARLQSFSGGQLYPLPADLDLSEFQAVAIWCRQFNVTFGYAQL